MIKSLLQAWSRESIGFRQGQLEDGDGVATMVVTLIGSPALIVGTLLVTDDRLGIGEVLLLAPLAALVGGALVAVSASMAAKTGATGAWLLRPAFGRAGSVLVSIVRLAAVAVWGVVGLRLAGGWTAAAAEDLGLVVPEVLGVAVVAFLGLLLTLFGLVGTIKRLIRKPLFVASVALVALVAWRFTSEGIGLTMGPGGGFWAGLQRAVEVSAVFLPFVQTVARRLHDETAAMSSFGVGYAVPATVVFAAGAVMAVHLGGLPLDLLGLEVGTAAVALAFGWVLIAELDQAFASFVAAGSEAVGIVTWGPPVVIGLVVVAGITGGAMLEGELPLDWATLLAAVALPAAVVSAVDFYFVSDNHYTEADIYGPGGIEGSVNLGGIACWLLAVVLGQFLDPVGPEPWVATVSVFEGGPDLPWRLIMALVFGALYVLSVHWREKRATAVYQVRGI